MRRGKKRLSRPLRISSLLGCVLIMAFALWAQDFEVQRVELDEANQVIVTVPTEDDFYYALYQGEALHSLVLTVDMTLGEDGSGQLVGLNEDRPNQAFFRVERIPLDEPRDTDEDGIDDVWELLRPDLLDPLNNLDAGEDPDGNGLTHLQEYGQGAPPTTITSSPADGESGVAVTRETILRFSNPLGADADITTNDFYAMFGNEKLDARIHMAADRRSATLFYEEPLPASARIRVTFKGNLISDVFGRSVDGDDDGEAGGDSLIEFDTLTVTTILGTAVCGRVFASELDDAANGNEAVNCPLAGVKITVDGREDELFAFTDQFGNFRLDPAPAGRFFVHIDGRTATNPTIPEGGYYPFVGKAWEAVAGKENNIGEVYLPLVIDGTLTQISSNETTEITFPEAILVERPELDGVMLEVPPNALFANDGVQGGQVGIAPVDPDRLPGELPEGLNFSLVITVQTDGATNFDRPVPICFPNLPDPVTGEMLPPGAETALWSFNHDTGRFEVVGSMTVSPDGGTICTNPGVGILAPGWHGTAPGSTGGGAPTGNPQPNPPGGESSPCEESKTNPILPFSGEKVQQETDLYVRGRGFDFEWTRRYASRTGEFMTQGHNWDFNYNLSLERVGRILKVRGGYSEMEEFQENAEGDYERREHFTKITPERDGSWTLRRADQTRLVFHPLDAGEPQDGKIASITDRNGNQMLFQYDAQGRLAVITDTLDRDIVVAYDASGLIESVTDFDGRQVRYTYYQGGEAGGSPGDLKSVRSPVVTGTPHGNDFPNGKTRSYTYSSGFRDERLNHNLISITDGRRNDPNDPTFGEGSYLQNTYSTVTNPDSLLFDRVIRQEWGGDIIDFHYEELDPADRGNDAVLRVIINDRNGNVQESYYDAGNRLLRQRDYTGRADPRKPTRRTTNRPTNKLRPSDPDFYETRWIYNDDSLVETVIHPNGNIENYLYERDLNPMVDSRMRGNVRQKTRSPGSHLPAGDQEFIVESFEYATDFGCPSCGFNFVTRHVDGRGNATVNEFDDRGNLIKRTHRMASIVEEFEYNEWGQLTAQIHPDNGSGHRRRDEYTYYANGRQTGYRATQMIDATGFRYTTSFEYDNRGNVVRRQDPRGFDRLYTFNALDQVIQEFSEEVTLEEGIRYEKRSWFDANNNLLRHDIENRDVEGVVVAANPWFTTTYDYEILNKTIRVTQEIDPTDDVVTQYAYDPNRNLQLTRYGEATNGNQPENTLTVVYDERDLVFLEIRAAGHVDQSTVQYDYDGNKTLVATREGIEDSAAPRVTTYINDGYNRQVIKTDPMGNICEYSFDANSNMTREVCLGELDDLPGSANNIRLREMSYVYDLMDRQTHEIHEHFKHDETGAEVEIGDGQSITVTNWSDHSQVLTTTNDNNHSTSYQYDTANRIATVTDAKGNTVNNSYDGNHNKISMLETDKSDLGNPDQQFSTTYGYDGLNRRFQTIDNIGNTNRIVYDSRSNKAKSIDAKGNVIDYVFDGLNRLTETIRIMTDTGHGTGNIIGQIVTRQGWDDTSRLITQTDDNGNTTTYEFDGLDRKTGEIYADDTAQVYTLDVHGNMVGFTDGNQNVVASRFDLLNRKVRCDVTVGPDVSDDTTFELYGYDGLSRMTHAEDDDSVVTRRYDSLAHQVEETLAIDGDPAQATLCVYDGLGNQTECTYPGGRVISKTYDELERKKLIADGDGLLATYAYVGPGRVERCNYGNGTRTEYTYDGITSIANPTNDFGVKKMIRTRHTRIGDSSVIDDRSYTWDRMGNKTQRTDLRARGPQLTHDYAYDSVYRLIQSVKSDPGGVLDTIHYTLDGVGNRTVVTGGDDPGAYTMDSATPEPADRQMNQYSTTSFDSRANDRNGNLISTNTRQPDQVLMEFDFRNRLVTHDSSSTGTTSAYSYDATGRRIGKAVGAETVRFLYDDWRVIEERDGAGMPEATYAYSLYIDEILSMNRSGSTYYFHRDDLYNVAAASDAGGIPVERYEYGDFGERSESDGLGVTITVSAIANPYGFTGRRHDLESALCYYRTRYLDSLIGRFNCRDTLGIWADSRGLGNALSYTANNPYSFIDPFGETAYSCDLDDDPRVPGGGQPAHSWICLGKNECFGFYPGDDWFLGCGPGQIKDDKYNEKYCDPIDLEKCDPDTFAQCIRDKKNDLPKYCLNPIRDPKGWYVCTDWRDDAIRDCKKNCK